jgi:hypothetical protein
MGHISDCRKVEAYERCATEVDKDDVVFITKGHHLERFMDAKAITDKDP